MDDVNLESLLDSVHRTLSDDSPKRVGEGAGEVPRTSRGDMSASAIARLIGLATSSEVQLLEDKIDLIVTKLALVSNRIDKLISELELVPKGSDIDRVEVQISKILDSLRTQ